MKIKASTLSILVKIVGCFMLLIFLVLKALGVFDIDMSQVILTVGGLELMVLPIDISKIRCARDKEINDYHDKKRGNLGG